MAVQQTTTQTILPEWYTNYAQQLMGGALSAAKEPYKPYELPRIAGFAPEQEQAFALSQEKAQAYKPYLEDAGALARSGASGSSAGVAAPYFSESTGMARTAGGASALGVGQPYFGTAGTYAQAGAAGSSLAAAQPYFSSATGSFADPGVAARYMSPYLQNVVSGIGDIAARNLREKILPEVNRTFIGGGTFGGSRSAEFTQRAIRDAQAAALAQQTQALQAGYKEAADLYGTEAGRALTAAGEVGRLAGTDYSRLIDTSRTLADIGQSTGQLASADYGRLLDAARAISSTGQAAGQLAGSDYSRMLEGASRLGALGEQAQTLGLKEAGVLAGIGEQKQALAQRSADLAYQDFLEQREFPFTQLQKVSNIAGAPSASGQTVVKQEPGPSGTSQVLGTLAGIAGTLGASGAFGSGGWLGLKDGGKVKKSKNQKAGLGWLKDKR